jgi:DNA-binding transcriptional ArsR family regulator
MLTLDIMTKYSHKTLTSEAEIAAYLHRTRMAILEALRDAPATASQIAAKLGVHPANLVRHIRTLKEADLIALVEKRDTGRNLEKYYATTATSFDVAPEANDLKAPEKIALAFARSDLSSALAHLPDQEERPVIALVASAHISPDDFSHFKKALTALVESFAAADTEGRDSYHMNLSIYPCGIDIPSGEPIRLEKE